MDQDKHLSSDITKFVKSCKEKQQHLLFACNREEKRINDEYNNQQIVLAKRHMKDSEKLQHTLILKRKALQRKLEHELQVELKLYKRYLGFRTQSTGRILAQQPQAMASENSIDTSTTPRADGGENGVRTPTHGREENHDDKEAGKNGHSKRRWLLRMTRKDDVERSYCDLYTQSDLKVTLNRLREEMDERIRFAEEESKMAAAHLDWEYLKNKQNIKRDYGDALAEFKQRRLSSLGQMKKYEIKGYFDIHRQWMISEQAMEMRERQKTSQDTLKRLAHAQAIERETACRLARMVVKGQKQVSDVLYPSGLKSKLIDRDQSALSRDLSTYSVEQISPEDRFIDQLFSRAHDEHLSTGVHVIRSDTDRIRQISSPGGTSTSEPRAQSSYGEQTICEREHGFGGGSVSGVNSKRSNPKTVRGKLQQKQGLRQAKSLQSITSALETCDHMHRALMDSLSKQQIDQWVDVLNQEKSITETLMKVHAERKKTLIEEEASALKRAQLEHEHRTSHLAVVLEATEKFAERTFQEEQQSFYESRFKRATSSNDALQAPQMSDLFTEYPSTNTSDIFNQTQIPSAFSMDQIQTYRQVENQPTNPGPSTTRSSRGHVIICRETDG